MARPNQARLDLGALRHNIGHARALAPHSKVMAVVKANAYGHGAAIIAKTLEPLADALAVACIEEAVELRAAGISAPILLLEGFFEESELALAATENFWICVGNERQLSCLENAQLQQPMHVWLKIDTGMHRLGIDADLAESALKRLNTTPNVANDVVLCTHFASADDLDGTQTREQLEQFNEVCKNLPGKLSAANSPGILGWPDSHFDWIRPGYMLYGNSPFSAPHKNTDALQPVMTLSSAIISIRDVAAGESVGYGASWTASRPSKIATVTIGYGDGYPRLARNGTPVLVNGQRASLAGRVSMDMITVDVTDVEDASLGDEVILWGADLPVGEVAEWAGTIGYELTTRMPARTPRIIAAP
ncbi:MAG: alanine racemase [Proteobacteria bacterium]|nr:alanine racemase [Pseudomonadota bacterium]